MASTPTETRLRVGKGALILASAMLAVAAGLPAELGAADGPARSKPKPAAGVDPGGVMVAFVGAGLDYTRGAIASRLARDGEGEIIGFDLVDRDRRPHCLAACAAETAAAEELLRSAPQTRLAVFKVDGPALAAPALQMAVQAKADVLVVTLADGPQMEALLRAAADRFKDALIIHAPRRAADAEPSVADKAGDASRDAPPAPDSPTNKPAGDGKPARADTVVSVPAIAGEAPGEELRRAAAIAAKAATIVAQSPSTRGAALKSEVEKAPR